MSPYLRMFAVLAFWALHESFGLYVKNPPYTEEERVAEYHKREYKWPLRDDQYHPNTDGWRNLMKRRFAQIIANEELQERWDGWLQTMASAMVVPNHTEFGWGLTQAPEALTDELRTAIQEGLPRARLEGEIDVIDGPTPLFIDRMDLLVKVLRAMQPILEAWSGLELEPSIAYGFRLYRNESRLWMHVDKTQTHVISCIYHIASSENAKPWPVVIESFDGNTISVVLKPGDILLYESAKAFHGRPSYFEGDWYTSVFVHFYPKTGWQTINREMECHYAVPPTWYKVEESEHEVLRWVGTSALEPECPDSWCNLRHAVKLEGPGDYGNVVTGGGKKYSLNLENAMEKGTANIQQVEL